MLIDCGSFRNTTASATRLNQITKAIAAELAGAPLDVVVGTHQHNDHLSGFVHCEAAFRKIGIGEVWLSWLDNPADKRAQTIGKAHHNLLMQLHAARAALRSTRPGARQGPTAARSLAVLDDVLGFYGASADAPPEVPAKAVKILKGIGARKPSYLSPRQEPPPARRAGRQRARPRPGSATDRRRSVPRGSEEGRKLRSGPGVRQPARGRFLDASRRHSAASAAHEDDYPVQRALQMLGGQPRFARPAAIVEALPRARRRRGGRSTTTGCSRRRRWRCTSIPSRTTRAWCWPSSWSTVGQGAAVRRRRTDRQLGRAGRT